MKFSSLLLPLGAALCLNGCDPAMLGGRSDATSTRGMNRETTYAPQIEAERRAAIAAQKAKEEKIAAAKRARAAAALAEQTGSKPAERGGTKVKLKPFLSSESTATEVENGSKPPQNSTETKESVVETQVEVVTPVESSTPPPVLEKTAEPAAFAVPVPGKTGFVTSPYSPDSGFIDVTGLTPGSEAKDPYTGKIFRVP